MSYSCVYCPEKRQTFTKIVQHLLEQHNKKEIKFKVLEGELLRTLNFKIIPELCREQGRTLTINEERKTVHVSKPNVIPKDSPFKKVVKFADAFETEKTESSNTDLETVSCDISQDDDNETTYQDLVSLLPDVIRTLKENEKLQEYISFNRLLAEKKFPLNNIAFLLFLDVVRWFSLDGYTTSMRYSDHVKLFWRTGLRLFGGRFLRFMSGPKNKGNIVCNESSPGAFDPAKSKVNFIVPDRRALCEEITFVSEKKPCIMDKMIEKISQADPEQISTYKICVDGKKINPCSTGQVDLWGYEDKPTYQEKQNRLESENIFLDDIQSEIERLELLGKRSIDDLDQRKKDQIVKKCRDCISIISQRIRDLRHIKMKKEIFLKKLLEKCATDWRSTQFSMIISSIKTNIYQIENCLEDLLQTNESFCHYAAVIANSLHLLSLHDEVNLQTQENFVCLGNNTGQDVDSTLLKQRSEAWFQLRKQCLITGSTINRAFGLEGLKKQKHFLDEKTSRKPQQEVSADMQRMFDYGTLNEINAISTFVSKFLPAFHPELSLYEEGCYIKKAKGEHALLVSPDGSVRNTELEKVYFGVEIKCPFPGKAYSTPVHYHLPHYYVPQVLSEMDCLNVRKLYFLSYSKESMTIQQVNFDQDLWNDIFSEVHIVNQNNNPKRLSETLSGLKQSISKYCVTNVNLVAEVKSVVAKPCNHLSGDCKGTRIYHNHNNKNVDQNQGEMLIRDIRKTILRCSNLISECHKLCAQRASEVLVFMVADLDRTYKPELPHAYPIAYALKGYSMKTGIMDKMIKDVLHKLYIKGLYTPVVSYDGQWAKLAFQSSVGEPLTLLELQKKVYNDVKKRSFSALTKDIFERSVVKVESFSDLLEKICYEGKRHSVIIRGKPELVYTTTVGTKTRDQIRFSSNLTTLLKTVNTKGIGEERSREQSDENNVDNVLSTIPSDVMSILDDDIIYSLNTIQLQPGKESDISPLDISLDGALTFQETTQLDDKDDNNEKLENQEKNMPDSQLSRDSVPNNIAEDTSNNTFAAGRVTGMTETEHSDTTAGDMDTYEGKSVIDKNEIIRIFTALQTNSKFSNKWKKYTITEFELLMKDKNGMTKVMTKADLIFCMDTFNDSTKSFKLTFFKSWNKSKLVDALFDASSSMSITKPSAKTKPRRRNPVSLVNLCKKIIKSFPKKILNIIIAENEFIDEVTTWRAKSPFSALTKVSHLGQVSWFSKPEFNQDTYSYIFSYLDVHHLITNCRIKVCKDGIPEREISKRAWIEVARKNQTNLKIPHVEDLVDKQSDAIARETFSKDVETAMGRLGFKKEAHFCKLVREFYEAEDDPGIEAVERCKRRLNLREWLLDDVNFCCFPPYGSHIRGIPNIMFQGFLTNIDRRIQLFPFVKSGMYNVRSLGSLEVENFFGEFQDLDPKGSGVIKAEEIPAALESASQLISTRLLPNRPFHMSLSRAKVYPVHELMEQCGAETGIPYVYPQFTHFIQLRDHTFDMKLRSKRKAQRKLATISNPDEPARGVAPVRQYHKCDESKILAHKRLGLELP